MTPRFCDVFKDYLELYLKTRVHKINSWKIKSIESMKIEIKFSKTVVESV